MSKSIDETYVPVKEPTVKPTFLAFPKDRILGTNDPPTCEETYVPVVERKYEKPLLGCMPEDCPLIDIPVRDFGPCATTTACESSSNPLDWYDALVHPWPAKEREPQVILK